MSRCSALLSFFFVLVGTGVVPSCSNPTADNLGGEGGNGSGGGDSTPANSGGGTGSDKGGNAGSMLSAGGKPGANTPDAAAPTVPADAASMATKMDAGMNADAGTPVPPPLFSETFESGKIDPALWMTDKDASNTVRVDNVKPGHGSYALHVQMGANTTIGVIRTTKIPSALHKHQFGRLNYFMTPKDPSGHAPVLSSGNAQGFPYADWHYEVGMGAGSWNLSWWSGANGAGEAGASAPGIPAGKWTCLEWEFDDGPSSLRMWVNGKEVANYKADVPSRVGAMQQFIVGLREWHPTDYAIEMFIDDIAIHTSRIGCLTN